MSFEDFKDLLFGPVVICAVLYGFYKFYEERGWFPSSRVKRVSTDKGSHMKHWLVVFSREMPQKERTALINEDLKAGKQIQVDYHTFLVEGSFIRAIISGKKVVPAFPYWKNDSVEKMKTKLITQWSHTDKKEAVVNVVHESGCALSFFATDYAQNKKRYKKEENIFVNIVGFAYTLQDFDAEEINAKVQSPEIDLGGKKMRPSFGKDFCGYFPADEPDEINFIGKILDVHEYKLGPIAGFIVTISLTPEFSIDTFIASTNLKIKLVPGKQVGGLLWLQGSLETYALN